MLTRKQTIVLEVLEENGGKMYGKEVSQASDGIIKHSTVYNILYRLDEKGYVTTTFEDVKLNGKIYEKPSYEITKGGLRRLSKSRNRQRLTPCIFCNNWVGGFYANR